MNDDMQDLMEEIEKTMVRLRRGEIVTGEIISVADDEITVNLGYKSDGIIPKHEISDDITVNPHDIAEDGDEIEVYVLSLDDGEGNVLLSKKRVDIVKAWDYLEEVEEEGSLIEANVVETVKGGVIAIIRGIRCFIPASHLSDRYVDDLSVFEGQTLDTRIIEIDRHKNKVILSRKVVLEEESKLKKEELFSELEIGGRIEGEVRHITNFGAFVDIGGVDGLIHISELSWGRVEHPTEVVNVGDTVEVEVLNFDEERGRISLGLKQTQPHPWETAEQKYPVGDIVEGKVVRLVDFGAFVELELGLDGLVHISEISKEHVLKPSDELYVGQKVNVKVLDIKPDDRRISLSIAAADAEMEERQQTEEEHVEIEDEEIEEGYAEVEEEQTEEVDIEIGEAETKVETEDEYIEAEDERIGMEEEQEEEHTETDEEHTEENPEEDEEQEEQLEIEEQTEYEGEMTTVEDEDNKK